jgi:histone arginine demethylase JMJD6
MLPPPADPDELRRHKVRKAKRGVRAELSVSGGDWQRHQYARCPELTSSVAVVDELPRVDCRSVSREEFAQRYERAPCLLVNAMESWPAATPGSEREWTWQALRRRFSEHDFKVGTDDEGYSVRLKGAHFVDYVLDENPEGAAVDDSPLYVFDSSFGDKDSSKAMLDDYSVPPFFREDLFSLVGEKRRPPYRWVVFGPRRSGSSLHIDPLATSAWNALLSGTKRWVLFPPGVPRSACRPRISGVTDSEAVSWFRHILPRALSPDWPHAPPIEALQREGEIMFVPAGWWHAVLNLEHTIAVTQNFVSSVNFAQAWRHTCKARPKLSARWLVALSTARPDLAEVARSMADVECMSESEPSSSSSSSSSSEDEQAERGERGDAASAAVGSKRELPSTPLAEHGASWRRARSAELTAR